MNKAKTILAGLTLTTVSGASVYLVTPNEKEILEKYCKPIVAQKVIDKRGDLLINFDTDEITSIRINGEEWNKN